MTLRVWAITFTELGSAEEVLVERDETGQFVHLVFADSAYAQALAKFDEYRDERLSFHSVQVEGEYGPDAHAHLVAVEACGYGDDCGDVSGDTVALRPYNVIGA